MNDEVFVFDDIINLSYQLQIEDILLGERLFNNEDFPWYFIPDITYNDGLANQGRCGFAHYFADEDDGIISEFHPLFLKLIHNSCKKINLKKIDVIQARSFLQLPSNIPHEEVDDPHIDLIDTDHFVMLYYVCDSDGDTIIYNETEKSESYTIKKKIKPKRGRVVLFDGRLYHTAEQPNNHKRCIVNYDLVNLSVDSHI
tara:strand:- start:19 stop:615 length:597 start_codon:yes stop_codon:yes gene_type:complete